MSRSDSTSNLYNVVLDENQSIFIPLVLCIFLCLDTAVLYRLDVFSINARIVKLYQIIQYSDGPVVRLLHWLCTNVNECFLLLCKGIM